MIRDNINKLLEGMKVVGVILIIVASIFCLIVYFPIGLFIISLLVLSWVIGNAIIEQRKNSGIQFVDELKERRKSAPPSPRK